MTAAEQQRHCAERAAQGFPPHLEDPVVAARVTALLLPVSSPTNKAATSLRLTVAAGSEVRDDFATPRLTV